MSDEKLGRYLEMLFAWNKGAGLTAFKDRREALLRGVGTAEAALPLLPNLGTVVDVGSGGGFPAVPLAIRRPALEFTLCEPAPLKAAFLRAVSRELDLRLEVVELQASEFLRERPARFNAATVRGVKLRRPLLKSLRRSIMPEGTLLVWTGSSQAPEYETALKELGFLPSPPLQLKEGSLLLAASVPRGTIGR